MLVPKESHIYNDSGYCVQQLSQLNLIPMASETATFTLEDVKKIVERTDSGRVTTGVGAIVIESPVRRKLGEMFDYQEMKRICAFARTSGIGTHLDGARLYMASGYTGISPMEYASHFDTVYVSLWKYFNAGSGAILAGSRELIDPLYHTRRMFGGGLPGAWPFAAVALHYFEGFEAGYREAIRTADAFFSLLKQSAAFDVVKMPNGSNIFRLVVKGTEPETFRANLRAKGVALPPETRARVRRHRQSDVESHEGVLLSRPDSLEGIPRVLVVEGSLRLLLPLVLLANQLALDEKGNQCRQDGHQAYRR